MRWILLFVVPTMSRYQLDILLESAKLTGLFPVMNIWFDY